MALVSRTLPIVKVKDELATRTPDSGRNPMSTSEDKHNPVALSGRVEYLIRRVFEKIGAALDFALRRGGGGQPRTDLTALAAHLERAVEEHLRQESPSPVSPNLFELRYDYETYMKMGAPRREFLQKELSTNIYEYIYNRRYRMTGPVTVRIAYDAFTRGLEVRAEFGAPKDPVMPQNAPPHESLPVPVLRCEVQIRAVLARMESTFPLKSDAEPAGIGRNLGNKVIIKDPTVSNFHAALVLRPDGSLEIADRGSANGTYVNGVMIAPGGRVIVRDGDRLRFGDVETVLTVIAAPTSE